MSSPELTNYIEEIALENPMVEIEEKHDMDLEKEKQERSKKTQKQQPIQMFMYGCCFDRVS